MPHNITRTTNKFLLFFGSLILASFFLQSCQKDFINKNEEAYNNQKNLNPTRKTAGSGIGNGYCWEDAEVGTIADSILKPTILGARLIGNPYSVANMSQAFRNLTNNTAGVTENAKYIRVKPSNHDQLILVEDLDVDWFDYPLDYELVQEGDYFDDGVTPAETIPWLYAVVPTSFTPPAGITYELLETIHVPNNYHLEKEAFRITGNNVDTAGCSSGSSLNLGFVANNTSTCDCSLRPSALSCPCKVFCGFNASGCTVALPTVPPTRIPAGAITVTDTRRVANGLPDFKVPIKKARMVARRFLKVDRTFTDNNGNYTFTKSFNNKVSIFIKFKNENAIIKGLRGARLWNVLMPVKIDMGKFRGNINNLPYNVEFNNDSRARGSRHFASATMHNTVQDYVYVYGPADTIGLTPNKLRILVVPGTSTGSTPMFAKRTFSPIPEIYVRLFILGQFTSPALLAGFTVLATRVDMTIGYGAALDVTLGSDQIVETGFHELAHASHYNKIGNTAYGNFVQATINQMILTFNASNNPYGNANTADAPIIALGESWAYHIGHYFTHLKYGTLSGTFWEQEIPYSNGVPEPDLTSNLNLLENWSPSRTGVDPFTWIPLGLMYDLMDIRNDFRTTLNNFFPDDQVSGYTNQQFFKALDVDVTSLQGFRLRLLEENGNTQFTNVSSLFSFYNY